MRPRSRTARDGVELPSLGTGQPPRAAGARGRHAAVLGPRRRRRFGRALVRSASRRRASRCRRGALPPRRCCFVSGCRPYHPGVGCRVFSARRLGGGRAVAPHERPARMMGGSASEQRPRERRPTPRHRRDTASARWHARRPTHTKREKVTATNEPAPRSGRARRDEAGGLQPRGLCG